MTAPVVTANPVSPIARLYDGLTLRVLGYANAVSLSANGTGIAFKVPISQQAILTHCLIDGFSAAKIDAGITLSYGYTPTTYGNLFSATFGNIVGKGVASVTVSVAGTGYTSAPTVALTSLDLGGGATAVATSDGSAVTAINVTNPGHGYVVAPTVDITGAGTSAEGIAVLGPATLTPASPIIIAQPVGLARIAGGISINWAISNAATAAGTCNITWLGGLL